jgi:hypothetical protein
MILWVLVISLNMHMTIAFGSHEDCEAAATKIEVPVECVAFAADIPEGEKRELP